MISIKRFRLVLALGLSSMMTPMASADSDSSASAGAFTAIVDAAPGVMIRVPVDAAGKENTDAAELRVPQDVVDSSNFTAAWEGAVDGSQVPQVGQSGDSSTRLNDNYWGWSSWNGYGSYYNYYYNYQPYYYYNGYNNYYSYNQPYYYNSYYGSYPYYRYYYWNRYY